MRRPPGSPLWTVVGLLLGAAVLLWVGSLRGGGSGQSALAVLALAVVAATLATAGPLRRVLGGLVVLVGALAVPVALGAAALPLVLGLLGAAALVAAGGLLVATGHRLPGLGARYRRSAPAAASDTASGTAGGATSDTAPADRERAMWDELDAGHDPTAS